MTHLQRTICFMALALMVSVQAALAQDPYSVQTRPSRGFMPNVDQLSSPVDSIDPVSGKLHIEIPLASLPRGRANSGFDLNLVYDSHLYDVDPEIVPPDTGQYANWGPTIGYNLVGIGPVTSGWWHYNVDNPKVLEETYVGTTFESPCPEGAPRLNYRLSVVLLDGSQHIMIPEENIYTGQLHDQGWSGMEAFSGHALPCAHEIGYPVNYTGWRTYYSIDGSYLKLDIYADSTASYPNLPNHPYYLYFPDGRV